MLPAGIITLWYGSVGTIPNGWLICDGNNGTPNLQNKFVVGAGDTYAVAATGGVINHTHNFTGNGHTHDFGAGMDISAGSEFNTTTGSTAVTGTTDSEDNLPPYHALAYIMKT